VIRNSGDIFATDEAVAIEQIMTALLEPTRERPLKTALSSHLFSYNAARLDSMADGALAAWIYWQTSTLESWRTKGFMSAWNTLLRKRDPVAMGGDGLSVQERMLSAPDGERKMTDLLHLAELLHEVEVTQKLQPLALLERLISWRDKSAADTQTAQQRLESDEDAVRIVTMHSAKGLEYPFVFCPYLWQSQLLSSTRDDYEHMIFHADTPGNPLCLDLSWNHYAGEKKKHKAMKTEEIQLENMRLCYVAVTRAVHGAWIYWGPFKDCGKSPLGSLLFPDGAHGKERLTAAPKAIKTMGGDEMLTALHTMIRDMGAAREIKVEEVKRLSLPLPRHTSREAPTHTTIVARQFTRQELDCWWRRGSFSAMVRHAHSETHTTPTITVVDADPESDGRDYDSSHTTPFDHTEYQSAPNVPLADFPAGKEAGTFIHQVFEEFDFQRVDEPGELESLLAPLMARHGFEQARWLHPLAAGLRRVLQTPLGDSMHGLRLCDIPMADRLDEMSFDLPIAGGYGATLTSKALTGKAMREEVLEAHRRQGLEVNPFCLQMLNALNFSPPLRGFLTGSIDLVFRAQGRYWVVDYKSNRLGTRDESGVHSVPEDYAPDQLAMAMSEHHYHLQYHLYTVALDRYLRWRDPSYEYDTHFGGCLYLFLRGMTGHDTPQGETGHSHGVFFHRPSQETIISLSRCLHDPGLESEGPT